MMKIVHICLGGVVTDGWGYQDNLLPKYHKRMGADVTVVTSHFIWNNNGKLDKDLRNKYVNDDGVLVKRLDSHAKDANDRFAKYPKLFETLEEEKPDVIFLHDMQRPYAKIVAKYVKQHMGVTLYADNHADYSNSATNLLSKYILHRVIWKYYVKKLLPYTKRFYGVLPARVDFINELYGIPKEKCELLIMGADDDLVDIGNAKKSIDSVHEMHGIKKSDFLIVTGGKIDMAKRQTLFLMKAVNCLNKKIDCHVNKIHNKGDVKKYTSLKLLVFGSVDQCLKEEFDFLCGEYVKYVGWLTSSETYKYIGASDLVVYPGRHSVLWEQTVAQGKPMIVKYWDGTTHVDIGGNVKYLYRDCVEEIQSILMNILTTDIYIKMFEAAEQDAKRGFLYSNIARQCVRDVL